VEEAWWQGAGDAAGASCSQGGDGGEQEETGKREPWEALGPCVLACLISLSLTHTWPLRAQCSFSHAHTWSLPA
jgi:hypothetical protein